MAEPEKIGEWSGVQIDPGALPRPADRPDTDPKESTETQPNGIVAFGLGLVVGFIPLIALAAALVGYLFARDNGQSVAADDGAAAESSATEADPDTPAVTAEFPATDQPTTAESETAVESAALVMPSAVIEDKTMVLGGTYPPEVRDQYVEELTILAIALGRLPEDKTTVDERAPIPTELTVSFYDAVVFPRGGDALLSESHPILDAVTVYLDERPSEVTIVSLAEDGSDRSDSLHLAQHRAGHVFDHLVDAGVDPARITIDARGVVDLTDGPVESGNRVDLVFSLDI